MNPYSIVPIGCKFTCSLDLDQLIADPARTVLHAAGNQLATLCKAVCEEEKAYVLDPLMRSWYPHLFMPAVVPY